MLNFDLCFKLDSAFFPVRFDLTDDNGNLGSMGVDRGVDLAELLDEADRGDGERLADTCCAGGGVATGVGALDDLDDLDDRGDCSDFAEFGIEDSLELDNVRVNSDNTENCCLSGNFGSFGGLRVFDIILSRLFIIIINILNLALDRASVNVPVRKFKIRLIMSFFLFLNVIFTVELFHIIIKEILISNEAVLSEQISKSSRC